MGRERSKGLDSKAGNHLQCLEDGWRAFGVCGTWRERYKVKSYKKAEMVLRS